MGFPCGSAGKESACNAGDLGSILGLGRSPGEGKGYPFQYSGPENSGLYSSWAGKESDMTEQLSLYCDLYGVFITDETEFRNFIVWLEDQKIRHYKIEDRGNLRNIHSSDWPKFFEKVIN